MPSFFTRTQQYPPLLIALLAKHPVGGSRIGPIAPEEIALRMGWKVGAVNVITGMLTWDGIDIPTMQLYLKACEIDFNNWRQMGNLQDYINNDPKWKHLRQSPLYDFYYRPRILKYANFHRASVR